MDQVLGSLENQIIKANQIAEKIKYKEYGNSFSYYLDGIQQRGKVTWKLKTIGDLLRELKYQQKIELMAYNKGDRNEIFDNHVRLCDVNDKILIEKKPAAVVTIHVFGIDHIESFLVSKDIKLKELIDRFNETIKMQEKKTKIDINKDSYNIGLKYEPGIKIQEPMIEKTIETNLGLQEKERSGTDIEGFIQYQEKKY